MNTADCIAEGNRQLSDTNFYQKMDYDLTGEHLAHITKLVNTMYDTGEIDENCRAYLVDFIPSTARFICYQKFTGV